MGLPYVSGEREGKGGSGGEEFICEISWEKGTRKNKMRKLKGKWREKLTF